MDVDRESIIEIDRTLSAPGATPSELPADAQEGIPATASPPASSNEVHSINLLLGAIVIGAQANVQWLRSSQPDLEAAQRTSARLLAQIQNLCEMVDGLRSGQT
ncbi:hypothetical protein [Phyllobacterium endophyticum]|uniref:hypothetical protein n=1 Tax=Phyllobacterium endophyticum TaxID=1149773 RepID=UPI0011C9EEDC|nr:hypothetical protein [Phyllobacterium endophyticum]TXR47030.1 hypothetical protein FVA77_22205 [Phyllobacterium endophyticum]